MSLPVGRYQSTAAPADPGIERADYSVPQESMMPSHRLFARALVISLVPVSVGCQATIAADQENSEALAATSAAMTLGDEPRTPTPVPGGTTFTPTGEEPGTRYPVDLVCPATYTFTPEWDQNGNCVVKTRYAESDANDTTRAFRKCDRRWVRSNELTQNWCGEAGTVLNGWGLCKTDLTGPYAVDRGIGQCPADYTLQVVPSGCVQSDVVVTTTSSRGIRSTQRDQLACLVDLRSQCYDGAREVFDNPDFRTDGVCVKCRITNVTSRVVDPGRCAHLPKPPAAIEVTVY